jgi:hypothetical protein
VTDLSRRQFLELSALALPLALLRPTGGLQLPGLPPVVIEPDVTRDTFNGLFAFVLPGDDPYSQAQGQTARGPGGVGSGGVQVLIDTVDRLLPASVLGSQSVNVPAATAIALLFNHFAVQVDPAAASGVFVSPFARLPFAGKADALRRIESDETLSSVVEVIRYVSSVIPAFAAFMSFGEAGVYDPARRTLRARPIGWDICRFGGPAEGHAGFRGYYAGRRAADPTETV